jgi:hypothetical protein
MSLMVAEVRPFRESLVHTIANPHVLKSSSYPDNGNYAWGRAPRQPKIFGEDLKVALRNKPLKKQDQKTVKNSILYEPTHHTKQDPC